MSKGSVVGWCVVTFMLVQIGFSQDTNAKIMEALFTKIATSLAVGTNTPAAGQSLLILANPGIAIDPAMNPATNQSDREAISKVLDRVPGPSWIYTSTSYRVSDIYSNIVHHHIVPTNQLTDSEKQQLAAANTVLFLNGDPGQGRSTKYSAYHDYQGKWEDAANAVEANRKPNGSVPPNFLHARQNAMTDWQTLGYKNDVDTALGTRESLTSRDPNLWFQQLSTQLSNAEENPGTPDDFFPVTMYPSYASWSTLTGWSTINMDASEIHNIATTDHTSSGGSAGAGFGLFSFNAGASHDSTDVHTHSDSNISSISMDVIRIQIDRPWMEGWLFRSRGWDWAPGSPLAGNLISDGATPPGSGNPNILMPYLPVGILVARNVKINGAIGSNDMTYHHDHTSVQGSAGWGPFSISGHYEEDHTKQTFDATFSGNGITIPGMQIIGWYCEVLQKMPSRDTVNFTWPQPQAHVPPGF
jgi:hypothetical protein